jgi:hypothetical protein
MADSLVSPIQYGLANWADVFYRRDRGERREKYLPYPRVRRVKGLDVFYGNLWGIIFGESGLARFWNWSRERGNELGAPLRYFE